MREKLTGIVISVVKHTEKLNVITIYSRERGRLVFLSMRGGGRSAKMRDARLLPMSVVEADYNFRPNVELQKLGAFSLSVVWNDIYFNPVKRDIVFFISEFLTRLLQATMPNMPLWDYLRDSMALLDKMTTHLADFHVVFLSSLLSFVGIQPDVGSYTDGSYFDMRTGSFTQGMPFHKDFIKGAEARFAVTLTKLNFSNMRALKLSKSERRQVINYLLHYYEIHFPGTSSLKSLEILTELYS